MTSKKILIPLFAVVIFLSFNTFSYALAIDNNCPLNVIHILQVTPALLCLEDRIDTLENTQGTGSGEVNTASNLGSVGQGVFAQKVGVDLQFKKLVNGTNIILSSNGTRIMINATGTGSGEANTASCDAYLNGQCIFAQKSGVDLQFKKVLSLNDKLIITSNSSNILFNNTLTGESTVCTNLGSVGEGIYASGNCSFKKLLAGTGISLASNGTRITITNTGVISNSCSAGIICSGTNPSVFTPTWRLLCSNAGTGSTLTCAVDAYEYLFVEIIYVSGTGGTALSPAIQVNNDAGNNYAWRNSFNGGADATATNTSECRIRGTNTVPNNGGGIVQISIMNIASLRKVLTITEAGGIDTTDTTAPSKDETACKWDNSTDQITVVKLMIGAGTNTYATGTQMTVWGHD